MNQTDLMNCREPLRKLVLPEEEAKHGPRLCPTPLLATLKLGRWAVEYYSWSPSHDQCGMLSPFGTSSADW